MKFTAGKVDLDRYTVAFGATFFFAYDGMTLQVVLGKFGCWFGLTWKGVEKGR